MLLMVEKGVRGGICQAIHMHGKANNTYMKSYNKKYHIIIYNVSDVKNLYRQGMSQKLPANGLKWVEKLPRLNDRFIKNYNENGDIGHFLEVDIDYRKKVFNPHKDLPFSPERKEVNKCEKLTCSKKNMFFI